MKTRYIVKDKTPVDYKCAIGTCPAIYSSEQNDKSYLIIGKLMPKDSLKNIGLGDLEKKIGEDEVLIEVPKGLIDDFKLGK